MDRIVVEQLSKCYPASPRPARPPWSRVLGRHNEAGKVGGDGLLHQEVWALRDVSFTVAPGTILGIIGPGGGGKTTLLKVLSRITPPTTGRAIIRGRVVSLLRMGAGFQSELSGRENVFLQAALYGLPRSEITRSLDQIVALAELGSAIDTPVQHYSRHMYMRLAFAIAMNMRPDVLLADEVLMVGDLASQRRCLNQIRQDVAQGLTVLFASHDMATIARICDRAMWLEAGEVVRIGKPTETVGAYERAVWVLTSTRRNKKKKEQKHRNAEAGILSVSLISAAGDKVGALWVGDDASLKLTFDVQVEDVEVRCTLDVYTRGVHVFRSTCPEPWPISEPGVYSATLRIPPYLLLDTLYSINATLAVVKDNRESVLIYANALSFQVYTLEEKVLASRADDPRRLRGVVAPRLDWETAREAAHVAS